MLQNPEIARCLLIRRRPWGYSLPAASILALLLACLALPAQQPAEPTDITPINGETYYVINQLTGLQMDLSNGSIAQGAAILDNTRTFTSLSQRWAFTRLSAGIWKISNLGNGLCLDAATSGTATTTVQNTCTSATTQQWTLGPTTSGYYTIGNVSTGLTLDLSAATVGAALDQTTLSSASQSQQWLLRPVFFRGIDNALLEKQEANKVANGVPWWNDAGQPQDLLQILKNHGVNMVRIRPTTVPPYATYTSTTCTGNGCYAETEAQDLDLAKRARKLGMSIELSFLFDGGSSVAVPGAWSADSLAQAESALYTYVKAEIEEYRAAGVMPDLIAIGNEVDTGFLNALGTAPNSSFSNFAAMEIQGMQAVLDASSDTSIGPAIPAPLRCIHVTPADNLSSFFTSAKSYAIPYEAMCQSYYPLYHGPLTAAQAAASNPSGKPIEQSVLNAAATAIGKPIFLIEVGEHYESGYGSNDPWYPTTVIGQRQFVIDVTNAVKTLPNNLGMGIDYWDATGVNVFISGGGYSNGDGKIDSLYIWNGLTLFDNADTQGYANAALANFSATLPGLDALGGKEDQTLNYKLVNQATGQILETSLASTAANAPLDTAVDTGIVSQHQQWTIDSNGDGFFQIANAHGSGNVLDDQASATKGSAVVQNTAAATVTAAQEWNVVSAGNGYFALVSKSSGLVLDAPSATTIVQTAASSITTDWVIAAASTQLWQIVPVHISATSTPSQLVLASGPAASYNLGNALGMYAVNVVNSAGAAIGSPSESITFTVNGPQGFASTTTVASSNGTASFNLSAVTLTSAGTYNVIVSASGLTSATASFTVAPAVLTVTAQNQGRSFGIANPTLTYGFSGFVNGDTQSVVSGSAAASTIATLASAPGSYSIAIAQGTLAASNYTFSFVPGTLTIGQAGTATQLAASAATANSGDSVTLTATVSTSVSGTPSGTVVFLNAGAQIGSGTLNKSEIAAYGTAALPSGIDTLTAVYQGDINFLGATSPTVTVTVSPQNVWVVNGNGTLSELTNAGAAIGSYTGGGATIAIDNTGFVWSASAFTLTRLTNAGVQSGSFTGGGLSGATALAIDGSGQVWAANSGNTLSQFSNSGTALSPAAGFTGTPLSTPSALAIDAAGNLWLANSGDSSVTEILGAADPVVTPLAIAVKTGTLGAKP